MNLDRDSPLALELQQEMAAAYLAACQKMVDSLEALRSFDATTTASPVPEQVGCRRQLIEHAAERVYFVLIQREALRLAPDPAFLERYEVTDEVRARLGPKPPAR
ncbi:MAG: hypothetical protein U1G07_19090 [Verrucomicrobiota bacterium]